MTTKTKLIIAAIILGIIIAVFAAIKLLPFWATLIAAGSFIVGIPVGWYAKNVKDKYFTK